MRPFHRKGKESAFEHLSTRQGVGQSRLGKPAAMLFPQLQEILLTVQRAGQGFLDIHFSSLASSVSQNVL